MQPLASPRLEIDCDLTPLHTLGLRARAARLWRIDDAAQARYLSSPHAWTHWAAMLPTPLRVLGGGSNLLPAGQISGTVLKLETRGRTLLREDAEARWIRIAGGEPWQDMVAWTLAQGWGGLENLSLIPGTVGAAPIQNIGAYGLELCTRFSALTALSLEDGRLRHFTGEDCAFGYRDSVFKQAEAGRWLILELTLRLPRRWEPLLDYTPLRERLAAQQNDDGAGGACRPTPQQIADAVIALRRSRLPDPTKLGNAGSFFHNPRVSAASAAALRAQHPQLPCYPQADGTVKLAAGWLIEQAGWRGRRLGPVGMYEKQALVLVNHGGACLADVRALTATVQQAVYTRFGVRLQPEPFVWE